VGAGLAGAEPQGPGGKKAGMGRKGVQGAAREHPAPTEQPGLFAAPRVAGGKTALVAGCQVKGPACLPASDPCQLGEASRAVPGCPACFLLCRVPAPLVAPGLVLQHLAAGQVSARWGGGLEPVTPVVPACGESFKGAAS